MNCGHLIGHCYVLVTDMYLTLPYNIQDYNVDEPVSNIRSWDVTIPHPLLHLLFSLFWSVATPSLWLLLFPLLGLK